MALSKYAFTTSMAERNIEPQTKGWRMRPLNVSVAASADQVTRWEKRRTATPEDVLRSPPPYNFLANLDTHPPGGQKKAYLEIPRMRRGPYYYLIL